MKAAFEYLLDPSERVHGISVIREWIEREAGGHIASGTLTDLIVRPLNWYLEEHGNQPGRIDIQAVLNLVSYVEEIASWFNNGRAVYPEHIDRLDSLWLEFQGVMGWVAIARLDQEAKRKQRWATSAGKAKRGKLGAFRYAVVRIADTLGTSNCKAVLDEIRRDCKGESDLLDDLRAARTDPVIIRFQEAPDDCSDAGRIDFVSLASGKEQRRTCKTLKNHLGKHPDMPPLSG